MAKAPRAGLVKTRLHPLLGPQGCARLQAVLIRRTVQVAQLVAPTRTYLALDAVDPPGELGGVVPAGVTVLPQSGPDLGSRMRTAAGDVFRDHRGPLLLIGTDAPTLTASHLRRAAVWLVAGQDAVFGPALDGGYYLVGMIGPLPALFTIDPALWGGPQVLTASLAAAHQGGLRVVELPALRDLDTRRTRPRSSPKGTCPRTSPSCSGPRPGLLGDLGVPAEAFAVRPMLHRGLSEQGMDIGGLHHTGADRHHRRPALASRRRRCRHQPRYAPRHRRYPLVGGQAAGHRMVLRRPPRRREPAPALPLRDISRGDKTSG